jgi:hypothetical protein
VCLKINDHNLKSFVSWSKKPPWCWLDQKKNSVRFIGSGFRKPAKHVHVQIQQGVKVNPARAHYLTKYIKDGLLLLIAFKDLGAHPPVFVKARQLFDRETFSRRGVLSYYVQKNACRWKKYTYMSDNHREASDLLILRLHLIKQISYQIEISTQNDSKHGCAILKHEQRNLTISLGEGQYT